jgi:hypothetical protein
MQRRGLKGRNNSAKIMTIERNAVWVFLAAFILASLIFAGVSFAQSYDPNTTSTGTTGTTNGTGTTTNGTGTDAGTDGNGTPGLPNTGGGAAAQ